MILKQYKGNEVYLGISSVKPSGASVSDWQGERWMNAGGGTANSIYELVIDLSGFDKPSGYFWIGACGNTSSTVTMTATKNSDHLYTKMYASSSYHYWNEIYSIWLE